MRHEVLLMKPHIIFASVLTFGLTASTAYAEQAPVPVFAQGSADAPSPWTGFSFGSEFITQFSKSQKARAGADCFVAYDRALDSHWTIGVSAAAGYVPYTLVGSPYKNVDFASSQIKLGYDMGQLKPYVTVGTVLTKATSGLSASAGDSLNSLFAGSGGLKAAPVVGAGFDFRSMPTGRSVRRCRFRRMAGLSPIEPGFYFRARRDGCNGPIALC